jgi:hypothetical protein
MGISMSNQRQQGDSEAWRGVLHEETVHRIIEDANLLTASGSVFGISNCGVVCTRESKKWGGIECRKCFPPWPEEETAIILSPLRLPKRVPQRVPPRRENKANNNSGWFDHTSEMDISEE